MLELSNVEVIYSDVILAVKGITLVVPKGSCVTLLGGNGAGKSTTLKAVSNLLPAERGQITAGTNRFDGRDVWGTHLVGGAAEQAADGFNVAGGQRRRALQNDGHGVMGAGERAVRRRGSPTL